MRTNSLRECFLVWNFWYSVSLAFIFRFWTTQTQHIVIFSFAISQTEEGPKYSRHVNGLFPAPFPQDSLEMKRICAHFTFLGIFLAKCLQDNRLVDIPLSSPFFKMLCAGKGKYAKLSRSMSHNSSDCVSVVSSSDSSGDEDNDFTDRSNDVTMDDVFDSTQRLDAHYFSDVITDQDFEQIHPDKAKFVKQLKVYVEKRQQIMCDKSVVDDAKRRDMLDALMFVTETAVESKLEDLG